MGGWIARHRGFTWAAATAFVALAVGVAVWFVWEREAKPDSFQVAGECDPYLLASLPSLGSDRLVKGLGFTYVVKVPKVRATINPQSVVLKTQPQVFDLVVIYARDAKSKSLLINFADQKYCGWVEPDALL